MELCGLKPLNLTDDPHKLKRVARLMKTVGHPSRLLIIDLLLEHQRLPVKDIYEAVNISQSSASQHLKALEEIGIVASERDGKNICYMILNQQVGNLLGCVSSCASC